MQNSINKRLSRPGRGSKGFILGFVILGILVLSVYVFSFHRLMIHQTRRGIHERLGIIAGMAAISCCDIVRGVFLSENAALENSILADLFKAEIPQDGQFILTLSNPALAGIIQDINIVLAQGDYGDTKAPVCSDIRVTFRNIRRLHPQSGVTQVSNCRDPVEKSGEMIIESVVDYQEVSRTASVTKPFKIVSMVGGVYSRFTLFVSETPWYGCYNSIGINFAGISDRTFEFPFGPRTRYTAPLILINGSSHTQTGNVLKQAAYDLESHGWVFLGPSLDQKKIVLNIPAGYSTFGGHFLFRMPPARHVVTNKLTVPVEIIHNPDEFASSPAGTPCAVLRLFAGFYSSAFRDGYWPSLKTDWQTGTSWLMPYGVMNRASRTLLVGPVLAGFLSLYALSDPPPGYSWYMPIANMDYSHQMPVPAPPAVAKFHFMDVFKRGVESFNLVRPTVHSSDSGENPVAFNLLFEFLGSSSEFPHLNGGCQTIAALGDPFFAPHLASMNTETVPGIHSHENFKVFFSKGSQSPDNIYYDGNIAEFSQTPANLRNLAERITQIIDLRKCESIREETETLKSLLFVESHQDLRPKRHGVFLIVRNEAMVPPLELPRDQPLYLDKSLVLAVNKGGILIHQPITSEFLNQEPKHLLTLIALEGDIYLGTSDQICAFIVALNPERGGRLLATNGIDSMNIFGGVALRSMGVPLTGYERSTMSDFSAGGIITFNNRFNPSSQLYHHSRKLVASTFDSRVSVKGGK